MEIHGNLMVCSDQYFFVYNAWGISDRHKEKHQKGTKGNASAGMTWALAFLTQNLTEC